MTVEVDGVTTTTSNFNNTLLHLTENGEDWRRLDIRTSIDGSNSLILSIANWDAQNPPEDGVVVKTYDTNTNGMGGPNEDCVTIESNTHCDGATATFTYNGTTHVSETMTNEPNGSITITDINTSDLTVSGTFDFKVTNLQGTQQFEITGNFTNQQYTVLN
jgi:hypothetical protein